MVKHTKIYFATFATSFKKAGIFHIPMRVLYPNVLKVASDRPTSDIPTS